MSNTNGLTRRTVAVAPVAADVEEGEGVEEEFKPLTAEQAAALRSSLAVLSPWKVVAAQAVAGLVMVVLVGLLYQRPGAMGSALYGAITVVLPSALLARGMSPSRVMVPGAMAFGFMLWELVKLGVSVAMLAAASLAVPDLSWPVLLVTMVVCMKMNWLALLWRGRVSTPRS